MAGLALITHPTSEYPNMSFEERIDTHAHFVPPFYREACEETGHGKPDGMPAIPVTPTLS
jgi:hypothetical protein